MKSKNLILVLFTLLSASVFAQNKETKVEVLYFKAQLTCCQARACNALEVDVQKVIDNNFKNKNVSFKEIKLNDPANADLIKAYNAKSQTVVLISTKKGKTNSTDVSDIVSEYAKNNDFEAFQKKLTEKINQLL